VPECRQCANVGAIRSQRAVAKQAVEDDQAGVGRDCVIAPVGGDQFRRVGHRQLPVLDRLAILIRRPEISIELEVIDEYGFALQALRLRPADVDAALRARPRGTWRPDAIYPPLTDAYAALRAGLGLRAAPEVAVLTGSGSIDPGHPLLASGALVLTTTHGAARLEGTAPEATTLVALADDETIDPGRVVESLRARGHRRILSEAGPHTFGALLEAGLVDELFLTSSPLLIGAAGEGSRYSLVEGADLVPDAVRAELLSLRRHGSHLFSRYALRR